MSAVAFGLVLLAATAVVGWLPYWPAAAVFGVAHAAFLVLVHRLVSARSARPWRPAFGLAFGLALGLRLVCLPHPPSLSDDVYRYLHEGGVVLAGENPYAVAPQDVAPELRGPYWQQVNNPDIPAAYPPAVQYALALGAWLSPHPIGMKLVFGLFDLLVFVVLWRALPRWHVPRRYALIHGACPLLAIEFAGQGHSDSLAVLGMVVALALAGRAPARSAVALSIATAAKLLPVVLLPWLLRGVRARPAALALGAFAATLALLYVPFSTDPAALVQGTEQYSRRWSGNASLFVPILAAAQAMEASGWLDGFDHVWLREGQGLAKLPLLLGGVVLLAVCWWRRLALPRTGLWFFTFFLAFAPTVHPWYVALLVPWLCFAPNPGMLLFCGTVFLAYHVLPAWHAAGIWRERPWITVLEYLPFYLGLLWAWWRPGSAKGGCRRNKTSLPAPADGA